MQDAFAAIHRRWSRLTDHDQMLPYPRTAVLNGCRMVHRRRVITRRFGGDRKVPFWSAKTEVLLGETRREVFLAVRALPRRQREAVVLRYYLTMSQARVLDTTAAGDTLKAGRTVVQGVDAPDAATISPDGHRMLVGRRHLSDGRGPHRYTIEEYSVVDGRKIGTLFGAEHAGRSIPRWKPFQYDATGRHLLFTGNFYPLSRLDENGEVTVLVRQEPLDSLGAPQEMSAAW